VLLDVKAINSYYEKSHILHDVSLELNKGELVCLLGRNGVGKTTTLKSLMGLVKPRDGSILFNSEEQLGKEPYQIARAGMGFVPEDRRIFKSLTVEENIMIGQKIKNANSSANQGWTLEKIYEAFPLLVKRKDNKGAHLSGGEQQMLTVARTLMGNPELILVDEPTEGLAPLIVKSVLDTLLSVSKTGVTILMVEQNFKAAIKIADRFYIMSKGQIVWEGDREALHSADDVRKTYLEV
jgi:branched-chain amino acid transport system ATP-binding protein